MFCLKRAEKFNTGPVFREGMEAYLIKQRPEDFLVAERSLSAPGEAGEYLILKMTKKRYTTEDAVQRIARALHIDRKAIGYAGSKDSMAVTTQSISIRGAPRESALGLRLKDITLEFLGFSGRPISLGDLEGNNFEITARGIEPGMKAPRRIGRFINYFGEQRFSTNNAGIGKAILKKDFKRAVELIIEGSDRDRQVLGGFLSENTNNYVSALKQMPWKTLTLYIHAYQSKLWNEVAKKLCEKSPEREDELIPIFGFGTEFVNPEVEEIYNELLSAEGVSQADFVIRQIPDLSSSGSDRRLFCEIERLEIGQLQDDELNPGKKKILLKFSLGKGCYATEAIKEIFG